MIAVKISVIIPAFNSEKTLARTLTSVLRQTWLPVEIIIVDDCSSDATAAIVRTFADQAEPGCQVKYHRMNHNSGPGAARNVGAALAMGDFLAFLDADDYWLPWHLATAAQVAQTYGPNWVVSQKALVEGADVLPAGNEGLHVGGLGLIKFLAVQKNYCTPGLVVSRDLFRMVGGFPESRAFAEDFELFIKLHLAAEGWLCIRSPNSVVCLKHLYLSGRGLSSHIHKMQWGIFCALWNSLAPTRYFWLLPPLLLWHFGKYLRRLVLIFRNG